jgi:hypothetical protein
VGPDDGAVRNDGFQVRVIGHVLVQLVPDAPLRPAPEPLVHRVPPAVPFGQFPPLASCAPYPAGTFNKPAAVLLIADVYLRTGAQETEDLEPLIFAQSIRVHDSTIAEPRHECQQYLINLESETMTPISRAGLDELKQQTMSKLKSDAMELMLHVPTIGDKETERKIAIVLAAFLLTGEPREAILHGKDFDDVLMDAYNSLERYVLRDA